MSVAYEGWAIVELMGHRRMAGRVSETEAYGSKLLRVDIPLSGDEGEHQGEATQFYGGAAIYCVTPATEEVARAMARRLGDPRPPSPLGYRLPAPVQDDEPEEADLFEAAADHD